jgi:hypothetical protein
MNSKYLVALALLLFITPYGSAEKDMEPQPPDRSDAEGAWGWFQKEYPFLADVFSALGLLTVLMIVAVFNKILAKSGVGKYSNDFASPGLRFPPGHLAHRVFFLFLDLLRTLALILVTFNFVQVLNWSDFSGGDWWKLFVLDMLPAVFWAVFFIVVAEFFKMLWIGSPDRWRDYMLAYGTTSVDLDALIDEEEGY